MAGQPKGVRVIEPVKTLITYPTTLADWESLLTRALLHADKSNADPIRSFEITPETLAIHCGLGPEHAAGAEEAFRKALNADPYLLWCLKNRTYPAPTVDVPNCMAMLALSLLVDSLLDGKYADQGQYRAKLAQWLGIDRSFMNLIGIATMWEELVEWLDERIAAGAPFRRLILPTPPRSWTNIGYTRYLSFPTKRDIALLRKLVERQPKAAEDASTLVRLLDPLIHSSSVSFGLNVAFQDFRKALRAGQASSDHRFWKLVSRARAFAGHVETPAAALRMEFDEDGARSYRLTIGARDTFLPPNFGSAAGLPMLLDSPNLGPASRRGILFFRSSGLASWTAIGEPPPGIGPFHIAIADRHARLAMGTMARFEASGNWHVTTDPVAASTVNDILRRLSLQSVKMSVRDIAIADGVRVGRAWLGHPRYLPLVEGAEGEIDVTPLASTNESGLRCTDGTLTSDATAEGDFTIADRAGRWTRRATFVAKAEVHFQLDSAAYRQPEQAEWRTAGSQTVRTESSEVRWDKQPYEYQDMIEALYAGARSGISEQDAVSLVDRAVGWRTWDMLRTLQESSHLDVRLRERWRGRIFTLGRPTVSDIYVDGAQGFLVSGALPIRLQDDLIDTVALRGGAAFRHYSQASLAPPLMGALGMTAAEIADVMGWAIAPPPPVPNGLAANRLMETSVLGDSYQPASQWDWAAGRFRTGPVATAPVSLVRLVHPGGRDHDLYRVTGSARRTFTSRHAAILCAYLEAGQPLFRLDGDLLRRITREGALPIELSRALRFRTLRNGGASAEGWAYTVCPESLRWLGHLLPGVIEGVDIASSADHFDDFRRGRGARRPLWISGGIAA